ncbi:MAG: response regulator transcription factor [Campylobacterales bacterium]|nr:response regulator transcription factor [Campylobacterales bacterium]
MPKLTSYTNLRILLLEDDFTLSSILQEFLTEQGYEVLCAYDGNSAIDLGYEKAFDLFLLDVKVPYCNGFDVLRELRSKHNHTPAIFITSLNGIDDLSNAYDAGCDDYLKKPFELKELELRIKALIKRSSVLKTDEPIKIAENIVFNLKSGRLSVHDNVIVLSLKEAKILKILLSHPNEILSSQTLIDSAWDFNEEASEESLRTHIKNLRKYLGKETILNVRGQGYSIENS